MKNCHMIWNLQLRANLVLMYVPCPKCHKCQGKHNISICLKNERTNSAVSSDSKTSNLSTNSCNSNQTVGPGGNLNNSVALPTDSTAVNVSSCKNKVVLLQTAKSAIWMKLKNPQCVRCLIQEVREYFWKKMYEKSFEFKNY